MIEEKQPCAPACWARPHCLKCLRVKAPRGRSVPIEMHGTLCTAQDCDQYDNYPRVGHLWDENDGDRIR